MMAKGSTVNYTAYHTADWEEWTRMWSFTIHPHDRSELQQQCYNRHWWRDWEGCTFNPASDLKSALVLSFPLISFPCFCFFDCQILWNCSGDTAAYPPLTQGCLCSPFSSLFFSSKYQNWNSKVNNCTGLWPLSVMWTVNDCFLMKLIATVIFTRIEAGNFLLCVMYFQPTALFLCRKKKRWKKREKK